MKEAAFLATIIPNPIRYHVYFARRQLTDTWEKRVKDLLEKMQIEGVISEEELAQAEATPIAFRPH